MSEWKLVPVEPTEDMVVSGFESWPDRYFSKPEDWLAFEAMSGCQQAAHKARLCYAAMLAAAPDSPVQSDEVNLPPIHGVSRVADNPCSLMLLLKREPTDDDLRAIHDALLNRSNS